MKRSRLQNSNGFTVVELLVVISIAALLVAVLLPVLGRAREVARRAICQSNLRQLYLCAESYGNENRGYYPGTFGLGQALWNQDTSLSCMYNWQWQWDSNRAFSQFVDKSITRCPSQEQSIASKQWINLGSEDVPQIYGTLDYAMKCSFGTNHEGTASYGYRDPLPGPNPDGDWNAFRGMYDWRFPHAAYGYGLNYKQEQPLWWGGAVHPQQANSIMFMDRERSPDVSSQDGTPYMMKASNHPDSKGYAADIANIVTKNGQVRAMNMEHVWGEPNYQTLNYYDISGYGEGGYGEYVDDEIAQNWW